MHGRSHGHSAGIYSCLPKEPAISRERTVEDFLQRLEVDAEAYFSYGKSGNLLNIGLTIGAIVSSLVAAVVVSSNAVRWICVGLAALPAAVTSIQKVTEVKSRSDWYFEYAARLKALAVLVEYSEKLDMDDFAKRRAAIELEMEKGWGKIGRAGAGHHSR